MASLNYLTVQDILWTNLQITGASQDFRYADLEEATFYQYAYGTSKSLVPQAARFLSGFLKKKPFAIGNEATALIGCLAFLKVNGADVKLSDAAGWFKSIEGGLVEPEAGITTAVVPHSDDHHGDHHAVDVRTAIASLLAEYKDGVAALKATQASS